MFSHSGSGRAGKKFSDVNRLNQIAAPGTLSEEAAGVCTPQKLGCKSREKVWAQGNSRAGTEKSNECKALDDGYYAGWRASLWFGAGGRVAQEGDHQGKNGINH